MTESKESLVAAVPATKQASVPMKPKVTRDDGERGPAPGEDRALGEPIQWAASSHRELYDALHGDNEPGKAHERAREWAELAKEVETAVEELGKVLQESETGWRGPAADAGRAVMKDLGRQGDEVGRTTEGVGRYLADEAAVMERAKAEMPKPPEVPAHEMYRKMILGAETQEMVNFATANAAAHMAVQNEQHQKAVDVMTAMETSSRQIDEGTPGFEVPREGIRKVRERITPQEQGKQKAASTKHGGQPGGDQGGGPGPQGGPNGPGGPGPQGGPNGPGGPGPQGGPNGPGGPGPQGGPNGPGAGDTPPPLSPAAEGPSGDSLNGPGGPDGPGGPSGPGSVPPLGDPNTQNTPLSAQDDGGSTPPPEVPTPELPEDPPEPAQTGSDSATPPPFSGGGYGGGGPVTPPPGSGADQQHFNQFSGGFGPNSKNQKWSGSLDDRKTPSTTTPESLPDTPAPPLGGAGGGAGGGSGAVPPLSAGGGGGGGASLSPGGSAGVASGAPGGGTGSAGGGGSTAGSTTGGTTGGMMGGAPMGGAGAAGARQGNDDNEHQAPEYLKDQSLFELEERPAPSVIGEKFKKKE